MIVAFSASHKDWFECKRLLDWCRELGTYPRHSALIVFGKQVTEAQRLEVIAAAKTCDFKAVSAIQQKEEDPRGWPYAPNQMFQGAMKWIEDSGRAPFLWLESDATPLKAGWLDTLEEEYLRIGRPFMGVVFEWVSSIRYLPHLTGVAIYPPNFRRLNPYPLEARDIPWDCTKPDLTLPRTNKTALMFHDWGDRVTNTPPTFPDADSLSRIPRDAVLAHRCKDGTLIDRLREQRAQIAATKVEPYPTLPFLGAIKGLLTYPFHTRPKRKVIGIRRMGAFGDAIAATCVAEKLSRMGYDIAWQTSPVIKPVLELCPALKLITQDSDPCDVNLDGTYEVDPERTRKAFWEIYIETANRQLAKQGIFIENSVQCTPHLEVPAKRTKALRAQLERYPRPWIFCCPRSNSFANRTVPDSIWSEAARNIIGTKFWLGTKPAPTGFIDPCVTSMLQVTEWLAVADLLVSVDSGPLHVAAALGVPCLALLQSSSPELHITDQIDFEVIAPANLECLNCQKPVCPLDAVSPPCQQFDPGQIALAVNRKCQRFYEETVSAVITAYKPPVERLNRSIQAVLPQVDEVVVTFNADGIIPVGALKHPKVRYVKTRLPDIGYGRNANFGARHTSGAYLLFLNDDVFLDPGAVDAMRRVMAAEHHCGMVGHLLRYPNGQIQHGGTRRNPGDLGWGHIDHRKTVHSITAVTEMENVTQASALMDRKAFYHAGCYNEEYFMYYEDSALSLQMRRAGWQIFYTPLATGIHDEHQTLNTLPTPRMAENLKRSRRIFARDWQAYFNHNRNRPLGDFSYE